MKQGAKCWSQSVGRYRARIRVYESRPGGNLYAEIAERGPGARKHHYRQFSLRHRDRDRAVQWAQDQVTLMLLGQPNVADPPPTVWRLIQAYLTHVKPQHKPAGQRNDIRAGNLWLAVLGKDTDLRLITLARWTTFIRDRRAGAIDAEGVPVPTLEDRRAVGAAAVASDLLWLRAVINFGTKWKESSGRYLLTEDPTRGFPTPRERNPKRPVASTDRYEALARVAGQVTTEIRRDSKRITVATDLPAILAIVAGTGRRISAVLQLQYRDLHLKGRPGAIRWPSGTDKMGREWDVPISPLVR